MNEWINLIDILATYNNDNHNGFFSFDYWMPFLISITTEKSIIFLYICNKRVYFILSILSVCFIYFLFWCLNFKYFKQRIGLFVINNIYTFYPFADTYTDRYFDRLWSSWIDWSIDRSFVHISMAKHHRYDTQKKCISHSAKKKYEERCAFHFVIII